MGGGGGAEMLACTWMFFKIFLSNLVWSQLLLNWTVQFQVERPSHPF